MDIKLNKPILSGGIKAIASKSQAHRLLICTALADKPTNIICTESSDDIAATASCLSALGAKMERRDNFYYVNSIPQGNSKTTSLDCGESGSTLRFLLPVACALGVNASFRMHGRLPSRPMTDLIEALRTHGCEISGEGTQTLHCKGQLQSGIFELPGDVSSQYISGLLFALPLLDGDSEIRLSSELESMPYIQMTLDALKQFGIVTVQNERSFRICGNQSYSSPSEVAVEGDWSNAAFWLCAGAIGKNSVECLGLDKNSSQGDSAIVNLLERFGASIGRTENSVAFSGGCLHGMEIDAADTPDLVPILAVVASVAEGKTVIYNAARLRIKESDRLSTVTQMLGALGADISETADSLVINGKPSLTGGTVNSHGDHRIAMAAAVAASVCTGEVIIQNAEAVNKSYPNFWGDFDSLNTEKAIQQQGE